MYCRVEFGHLHCSTCHLLALVSHYNLFLYADDSTLLKAIATKDDRIAAANELNVDLRKVCPALASVHYANSFHHVGDDSFLLQ